MEHESQTKPSLALMHQWPVCDTTPVADETMLPALDTFALTMTIKTITNGVEQLMLILLMLMVFYDF